LGFGNPNTEATNLVVEDLDLIGLGTPLDTIRVAAMAVVNKVSSSFQSKLRNISNLERLPNSDCNADCTFAGHCTVIKLEYLSVIVMYKPSKYLINSLTLSQETKEPGGLGFTETSNEASVKFSVNQLLLL